MHWAYLLSSRLVSHIHHRLSSSFLLPPQNRVCYVDHEGPDRLLHAYLGRIFINGRSLDLASVIAVARLVNLFSSYNSLGLLFSRHCSSIRIDETVVQSMEKSAKVVQDSLEKGETIYGQ